MKILGLLAGCLGAALACSQASAQSTDGYHAIQVFPMVTDTASFAQRFNFRNPNTTSITIKTRYYPANTFTAQSPLDCSDVVVAGLKAATVNSLRDLCGAGLPGGSQFGFLYMYQTGGDKNLPFAAFSRVSNPLGMGFTEESFPAHTFTSADAVVNGIRRLSAQNGQPAYQTNCFVGILNEVSGTGTTTPIQYQVNDKDGNVIGSGSLSLKAGQIQRLFDVFATAGAPALDYNDARFSIKETGVTDPGLMAYCTVQDNTSFSADFRIAKQEFGSGGLAYPLGDVVGSQDNSVTRNTLVSTDSLGRVFNINAGSNANAHIIYFRHPDYVSCELIDAGSNTTRLASSYGLEMRIVDDNGNVFAGGNNATGFGGLYMGDKAYRNNGSNTRYRIEVQDNGSNSGAVRSYKLHCTSGSGHTMGDLIRYHEAAGAW
jgi:hypothetical protein